MDGIEVNKQEHVFEMMAKDIIFEFSSKYDFFNIQNLKLSLKLITLISLLIKI